MRKCKVADDFSKQQGLTQVTIKIPLRTRLLVSLLQLLVVITGFFLMLLIMSFNVWVFLVAMLGLGLGKAATWAMPLPNLH